MKNDDIASAEAAIAARRERLAAAWAESKSATKRSMTSPIALASAVGLGFLVERATARPKSDRGERRERRERTSPPYASFWGALTGIGLALARDQARNVGSDWLKDLVMRRPDVKPAAERAAEEAARAAASHSAAENAAARREAQGANQAARDAQVATAAANEARSAAEAVRANVNAAPGPAHTTTVTGVGSSG